MSHLKSGSVSSGEGPCESRPKPARWLWQLVRLSSSERERLISAGVISPPAPTPALCAHGSCKRDAAPGRKICEHHLKLQRARNHRWEKSHA